MTGKHRIAGTHGLKLTEGMLFVSLSLLFVSEAPYFIICENLVITQIDITNIQQQQEYHY